MKLAPWRIVPVVVGALLVAFLVWAFTPPAVEVDVAAAENGPLQVTVDHEGKTRVRERYTVSMPLDGRLRRIELDAGDPIVAGKTVLAVIEPAEPSLLDVRTVAQAEARVKAAEAAKERSEPQLRSAKATRELAETNYGRVHRLFQRQTASQEELDSADHRLRVAGEEVRAAQFAAQIADFELDLARAALVRSRPGGSGNASPAGFEIRAPVDGRVLRVFQESEATLTTGARLLEVGDPTDLEVEVDVLSADAVKIAPGAKAILEHWGGAEPLSGTVRLVEPSAFTKVSALGVEEQRVNVVIDIRDPLDQRKSLGDAFRVEAKIVVWESKECLKVPSGALFRRGGDWAVFVVVGGRAKLRTVRIGRTNGIETELLEGLREGDVVILHPSDRVADGTRVQPRPR